MENGDIFAKIKFLLFSWVPPSKISFRPLCVRGCAWLCTGARKCTYMYVGVIGCVRVGGCGMRGCAWVCVVVCESAQVSASVRVG